VAEVAHCRVRRRASRTNCSNVCPDETADSTGDRALTENGSEVGPGALVGDRYRIVEMLGEGGMGTVWTAEHLELHRKVAIKVLQKSIGDDPDMRRRFEREAHTLAAMAHPNVVALNDYGIWRGNPYLVMELLEGRTLRDLLDEKGTLPFERARGIEQQILRALAYAHGRGVIHRDLKPGNVFLQALPDEVDHVKILDFGFAKFVNQPAGSFVSKDGIAVGTPAYMAPEQGVSVVDERADVYAAGVLLFEMLSGRRPFEGEPLAMIRARREHDAPRLGQVVSGAKVTPALESCLARALARRPADRFATCEQLGAALSALSTYALEAVHGASARPPEPAPSQPTEVLDSAELARITLDVTSGRSRLVRLAAGLGAAVFALVLLLAWRWL
jgi:eukaryotic-like serine/threonine-protein kinase